jgi:flagellar hook assembly protein FlgD
LQVDKSSEININVYNIYGQIIKNIFKGTKTDGMYYFYWNGKSDSGVDAMSGVYFVCIDIQNNRMSPISRKIILLR